MSRDIFNYIRLLRAPSNPTLNVSRIDIDLVMFPFFLSHIKALQIITGLHSKNFNDSEKEDFSHMTQIWAYFVSVFAELVS